MKLGAYILFVLFTLACTSFGEPPSHGGSYARGVNGQSGFGQNNMYGNSMYGMNGMGGMGGMGGFGGMGGMGGMGGGGNSGQSRQAAQESQKFGQEAQKKVQESSKEFQQNIEKQTQSFVSSLDKLNPPDTTAETMKELKKSSDALAEKLKEDKNPRTAIVDEIVQSIKDGQESKEQTLMAISQMLTSKPEAPPKQQSPNMIQRLSGQVTQPRNVNPLGVAINATSPQKNEIPSFSSRTQRSPLSTTSNDQAHLDEGKAFFQGASAYKSPIK